MSNVKEWTIKALAGAWLCLLPGAASAAEGDAVVNVDASWRQRVHHQFVIVTPPS